MYDEYDHYDDGPEFDPYEYNLAVYGHEYDAHDCNVCWSDAHPTADHQERQAS